MYLFSLICCLCFSSLKVSNLHLSSSYNITDVMDEYKNVVYFQRFQGGDFRENMPLTIAAVYIRVRIVI